MVARRLAVAIVCLLAAIPSPSSAAERAERVLTSPKNEESPAAAPGWLVWSEGPKRGSDFDLIARPTGERRFQVNPRGTQAYAGSIEGTTLVYNEVRRKGDIVFFDLGTRERTEPPAGINTSAHESVVSFSGDWLLFRRSRSASGGRVRILLRNLETGDELTLQRGNNGRRYTQPGTVRGDYATWLKCRSRAHCDVFRHQISTGVTTQIPNPKDRAQYAPSVTNEGHVYFVESRNIVCGANAALWRHTITGIRERIGPLPPGHDAAKTSPVVSSDGTVSVYFDAFDCEREGIPSDIYRITL